MEKFERHTRRLIEYCKHKLRKYPNNYIVGNKEPYITALKTARKEIRNGRI